MRTNHNIYKHFYKTPRLDRWAYLAGLIEADGHIRYSKQQSIIALTIAGHKNQALHFYWLACAVGVPFTLTMRKEGNTLVLVWTNPHATRYIKRRLSAFISYHNSVAATVSYLLN